MISLSDFIEIGISSEQREEVKPAMTVGALVAGMPMVYSTPYMIQVMEITAEQLTAKLLPKGWVSVGTRVDVKHLKATPVGFTVTTRAEVIAVTEREIQFAVSAHDGVELIGEGVHLRGAVEQARFEAGMARKIASR